MVAFLVFLLCIIYFAVTPDVHSVSELSKLDIIVIVVCIISYIKMLFWLDGIGGATPPGK